MSIWIKDEVNIFLLLVYCISIFDMQLEKKTSMKNDFLWIILVSAYDRFETKTEFTATNRTKKTTNTGLLTCIKSILKCFLFFFFF